MCPVAYRSWLKDVRNIQDLGAHCHIYREGPDADDREEKYDQKWLERLKMDLPVDDASKEFFGSRMHDSWVQAITRTPSELRIRLSSINADIFAIGLADLLGIQRFKEAWPVDLVFADSGYVNAVRPDRVGSLRWADWRHIKRTDDPCDGDQFLYDWFFQQDGRIQWVAEIHAWRRENQRLDASLYFLVDCARARAEDFRRQALAKVFSENAARLWDDAVNGVDVGDKPYGPWGMSSMDSFLRRRIAAYGLDLRDLMPTSQAF